MRRTGPPPGNGPAPAGSARSNAVANQLAPIGMGFERDKIRIGQNIAKIYGIVKFPSRVRAGWLSRITDLPDTVVAISFEPCDNADLLRTISANIRNETGRMQTATDPLEASRAGRAVEDNERLIEQIDRENETVGFVTINIMALSADESGFAKVCRRIESRVIAQKCKIRALPNLQKESYMAVSPTYPANGKICQVMRRIMPMTTFVGGIPFSATGFSDRGGYYFARDHLGGLVMLDPWSRHGDRQNSNFLITGASGTGKSTCVKAQLIMNEYMAGTKIIVIDPESEYSDLCAALGGDRIDATGGRGGKINPLQVNPSPRGPGGETDGGGLYEDIEPDGAHGMNDLALHMKNLEIFFSLYVPSLTDMHMAVLKRELVALYADHGITWQTDASGVPSGSFPVIAGLHARLERGADAPGDPSAPVYGELAALLHDAALGGDAFLWNGHTTIGAGGMFLVLDTNRLIDTRNNVKRAQYFLLLQHCWNIIAHDRTQKVMFVCDEAYLMIDPQVPESLIYLRNVAKRIRKYEGALVIISQSVNDYLDPAIRQHGQALVDNPCYKIFMGTDGQNLKDTAGLFGLTEAEQELLAGKKRGQALFAAGGSRMKIQFDIHRYKLDSLGTAGGR